VNINLLLLRAPRELDATIIEIVLTNSPTKSYGITGNVFEMAIAVVLQVA
jgi:hypothetical protein